MCSSEQSYLECRKEGGGGNELENKKKRVLGRDRSTEGRKKKKREVEKLAPCRDDKVTREGQRYRRTRSGLGGRRKGTF